MAACEPSEASTVPPLLPEPGPPSSDQQARESLGESSDVNQIARYMAIGNTHIGQPEPESQRNVKEIDEKGGGDLSQGAHGGPLRLHPPILTVDRQPVPLANGRMHSRRPSGKLWEAPAMSCTIYGWQPLASSLSLYASEFTDFTTEPQC